MPIRGYTPDTTTVNDMYISRPTGTRAGDVMVWWGMNDTAANTFLTAPADWRRMQQKHLTTTFDANNLWCAVRVATVNDPASWYFNNSDALNGGIVSLSGVRLRGAKYAFSNLDSGRASPWTMPMRGIQLTEPCDVLWIGSSDVNGTAGVVHTPPPGFTLVQSGTGSNGWNNWMIAHKRYDRPQHTGTLVGRGTLGGQSAAFSGWLFAFPLLTKASATLGTVAPFYSSISVNVRARSTTLAIPPLNPRLPILR